MNVPEKIGFIGLGRMGQPMASRLLDAGFSLTIYDLIEAQTVDLGKRGARVVSSPKEVAAQSDIIIAMVPDDAALEAVTLGENGILAGARERSIFIVMSTVSPKVTSQVASVVEERGVKMLRSPVSGTTNWAVTGELTILVSGDKQAYEKCQKVLATMGKKIFYLGTREEAVYHKLVVNIMVAITSQMLAEAVTFGKRAGLDQHKMLEVISGSVVASPILCHRAERLAERNFTGGGSVRVMAKDLDLALAAGQQLGSPMPTVGLVRQFLGSLEATGRIELDHAALALLVEELAGIKY